VRALIVAVDEVTRGLQQGLDGYEEFAVRDFAAEVAPEHLSEPTILHFLFIKQPHLTCRHPVFSLPGSGDLTRCQDGSVAATHAVRFQRYGIYDPERVLRQLVSEVRVSVGELEQTAAFPPVENEYHRMLAEQARQIAATLDGALPRAPPGPSWMGTPSERGRASWWITETRSGPAKPATDLVGRLAGIGVSAALPSQVSSHLWAPRQIDE
jgi:hypothetical protein